MEIKEFKEFINPEQKDYDLLGEHTIKKKEDKEKDSLRNAFNELYFSLGCPEDYELAPYGITDNDFTNPSKKSFEALRKYAIDYNLINDNPKGRK
mgnify:FL=1